MKKWIACFLAAVLLVPCFIGSGRMFSVSAEENDYGLTFNSNGDGTCRVSGNPELTKGDVVIPSVSPDGEIVTKISSRGFAGCTGLKSVEIPSSVTSIDFSAFSDCSGLESISVEKGNSVYYSDGNCIIEKDSEELVLGCKNSVIPSGITGIGSYAFAGCTGLKSVEIPSSVTSIDFSAFSNCSGLESISVEKGNSVYYSDGNCIIEKDSEKLVLGCKNSVIPSGMTEIGQYAFYGCVGLKSIVFPPSVWVINNSAFAYCTGLTSVVIPETLVYLKDGVFFGCSELKTVTIDSVGLIEYMWNRSDQGDVLQHATIVYIRADIKEDAPTWFTNKFPNSKDTTLNGTAYVLYTTPSTEITDEETGVSLSAGEGVLPTSTVLTVESSDYVTESAEKYTAFDISLEVDGVKVQPNGNVKVSLPIPEGYDRTRLTIYRVEADGSETELACTVEGDFAVFETDHFSVYVLAEKAASEPSDSQGGGTGSEPSDTQGGGTGSQPSNTQNSGTGSQDSEGNTQFGAPQTGDGRDLLIWTALLCASSAAVFTVVYRRKRVK